MSFPLLIFVKLRKNLNIYKCKRVISGKLDEFADTLCGASGASEDLLFPPLQGLHCTYPLATFTHIFFTDAILDIYSFFFFVFFSQFWLDKQINFILYIIYIFYLFIRLPRRSYNGSVSDLHCMEPQLGIALTQ